MLPSFLTLERQHINDNVLRVVHALKNEEHHLSQITNDWSSWDDTYSYIVDHNSEYESSNLLDSSFAINQLNLIYLLDNSGQRVWGKVVADDFETPIELQSFEQDRFSADFPLFQYKSMQTPLNGQKVSGLLMTSAGPMLCAAMPILDSIGNGPSHGTLIMGRFLSRKLIQKISRVTSINYEINPVPNSRTDYGSGELSTVAVPGHITYQTQDNILIATTTYADLIGNPAIEITVYEQREIFNQGHKALRMALILMAVGITFALAMMLLMLQKSVIAPVNLLTRNILSRRQSKQSWKPLEMESFASQEICLFTEEFNQLMESLDSKNTQLAEVNFSLMGEAKKLKEAQGILKSLDRLKSEFISTAAHELRTPVASIMGFTELLSDPEMIAPFSEAQKQDFLQEIYDNCERLAKNVDDILDVSRIEAGRSIPLDKQSISTEALLGKIINHFKLKAKHQLTLEIKPSTPENMVVDVHRISQVMENLLSNAIKYSPKESRISIVAERDGKHCKVVVADQGIGMTEEQVARVFDKFYRVDSSDTAVRGLGLGMCIVKQIIEDHGGTIWVDSLLGEGSRVYFTLPIANLDNVDEPLSF
jgi:signal transduction histidine kinase